jgi:hypothetical protein
MKLAWWKPVLRDGIYNYDLPQPTRRLSLTLGDFPTVDANANIDPAAPPVAPPAAAPPVVQVVAPAAAAAALPALPPPVVDPVAVPAAADPPVIEQVVARAAAALPALPPPIVDPVAAPAAAAAALPLVGGEEESARDEVSTSNDLSLKRKSRGLNDITNDETPQKKQRKDAENYAEV